MNKSSFNLFYCTKKVKLTSIFLALVMAFTSIATIGTMQVYATTSHYTNSEEK